MMKIKEFIFMCDSNALLTEGFKTSNIDSSYNSNLAYRTEFLSNNAKQGKKVIVSIEQELLNCTEFKISVAFITKNGITPLLQTLKELEKRGVRGKILTTNYLDFCEPEALKKLASLKNIELKMFLVNDETVGFHTKGYIFKNEEIYKIIIGSSNLTMNAITRNMEWNTKIVSNENGEIAQNILAEFDELWNSDNTKTYEDFIEDYCIEYETVKAQRKQVASEQIIDLYDYKLKPNSMQIAFIKNLNTLIENKASKAMLLSSTGTGKTLASAFAMRDMQKVKAQKVLFVVHREQISKQAMKAYKRVFGKSKTYGLISGNSREFDAEYIFATMQMMSKPEIYQKFRPDQFDVVILDECHHAGADSYRRIMDYFTPQLWLGMTASPDTNNYDIYSIFDHNIAYEIRLQKALEENLLCPFHYFGITDLEIDGKVFDDQTGVRNFEYLISDERVKHVIKQAEYYGHCGDRVKGLIFCSRKDEAKDLSNKFNNLGYKTVALTGEDTQEYREDCIERLVSDENLDNRLDYIFTVDIFNEGVDVPEINQVIMLRPTESPVIFIQQLGRGLRKHDGKDFVVILDFIGNYQNNFMIPVALSGDRSYNKDTMRRYTQEGSKIIPGSSTIHFDEITKKRIYESIDSARTDDMRILKESYTKLKYKLGRIPSIKEFKEYGEIDITKIFNKCNSYYAFLKKVEPEYKIQLTKVEESIVEYVSKKICQFKRIHDLAILKYFIEQPEDEIANIKSYVEEKYNVNTSVTTENSVYRNLTNMFVKEAESRKYSKCVFIEKHDGYYCINAEFKSLLENTEFKEMLLELINFGIARYNEDYSYCYKDMNLQLYQKYTYEDVCRLLNWKKDMNALNIGGYFYDGETKTMPVFINYEKADDAIAYEDRFVNEDLLIALSKHPRRIDSSDANHIYKRTESDRDNKILLFVRKNKDDNEAKEFYFLGEIFAQGEPKEIFMDKTNDTAFEINYRLDVPVRTDIYDYLVRE